jgi:hypothetical protein
MSKFDQYLFSVLTKEINILLERRGCGVPTAVDNAQTLQSCAWHLARNCRAVLGMTQK